MVFVLASPMCFHHNNVCNGITLLWSPIYFLHNFVCNGIIVCTLLCFHAFPQHSSIALGSKLAFII
jgi:hypothetical protein